MRTRDRVKRADRVHVGEGDYELVTKGHTAPNEPSVAALRHDWNFAAVTPADDVADLPSGLWLEDGGRATMVFLHPVIAVRVQLIRLGVVWGEGGQNCVGWQNGPEVVDVF